MALEEWKDFVGNAATFFTILQFVMGSQVVITCSPYQPSSQLSPGVLRFLQKEDYRRDLVYDIHSGGGDDNGLVQLRSPRPGLRHTDCQWDRSRPTGSLLLLLL